MPASTPWKLAVTGGVGIVAGAVMLSIDWTLAALAAFTGLALVARRTLHLVSAASFVGFGGAFAVLEVAGDVGVGITALAWPASDHRRRDGGHVSGTGPQGHERARPRGARLPAKPNGSSNGE